MSNWNVGKSLEPYCLTIEESGHIIAFLELGQPTIARNICEAHNRAIQKATPIREMTVEEVAKIVMEQSSVKVAEHWDYPVKIDLENQTISQDTTQPKVLTSETYRGLDPKMAQTIAQALAKLGTIRVVEKKDVQ